MVSEVGTAARYAARLMRMHSLDEDPDGCGLIEGRRRPNSPRSTRRASSRLPQAHIWPTRPGSGTATILACWNDEDATGFRLELDEKGALPLAIAVHACGAGFAGHFNSKIDRPRLVAAALGLDGHLRRRKPGTDFRPRRMGGWIKRAHGL